MSTTFYSIDEVSYILGLSPQTVRKLIRKGVIFAVKLGHCYRIPQESLDKLLK